MTTRAKLGIGAAAVAATLVVGIGIGSANSGSSTSQTASVPAASVTPSSAAAQPPAASSQVSEQERGDVAAGDEPAEPTGAASGYGDMPRQQEEFLATVVEGQETNADNDLKLGKALAQRNKGICKIIRDRGAKNWTGKLVGLDATNDGLGIVSIEIADGVHISTWNNAFSDMFDNTLIEPGSLFDDFLDQEEGDIVRFSGTFVDDSDTCVNDSRITLSGKLRDPDFKFKFKSVGPVSR